MSWTSSTIIKKHLQDCGIEVGSVTDEYHVLNGTVVEQLGHAYITTDSETVKTIDSATPYYDGSNKLSGTSWKSLDHAHLVPGSFVAASNTLLSTIYVEGVDFVVDYAAGKIKRVTGTSIPDEGTVYVWYQFYTVQARGTDYSIDYEAGTVVRLAGSGIADGSQVWVDYKISAVTLTDNLISQAIVEAEGKILDRLSSSYSGGSTDQGLKTGATELALSIISREMAAEAMRKYASSRAASVADQWRKLCASFEEQAWKTLSKFLASCELRSAAVQANMSYGGDD